MALNAIVIDTGLRNDDGSSRARVVRGVIVLSVQIDTHDVNTLNEIKMLRKASRPALT